MDEGIETFWQELLILLNRNIQNQTPIYITTHKNADPDALAGVWGLKELITQINPSLIPLCHIICPTISKLAQKIADDLQISQNLEEVWPESIPTVILLDSANIEMTDILPPLIPSIVDFVVIDHHHPGDQLPYPPTLQYRNDNAAAVAEVISSFWQLSSHPPDRITAMVLTAGILTDSGMLRYGSNATVTHLAYLLAKEIQLNDVLTLLFMPIHPSERMARLKAASRIEQIHKIGAYFIVFSQVSSYEASACKALLDIGADIAFIWVNNDRKPEFRISARAGEQIIRTTRLHLGKLLESIGLKYAGLGGGHDGAAGCYAELLPPTTLTSVEHEILKQLRQLIEQRSASKEGDESE